MAEQFVSSEQVIELQAIVRDLRAENARLQAQVKGLNRELSNLDCGSKSGQVCNTPSRICVVHWPLVLRERDRYKALAERHREALEEGIRVTIAFNEMLGHKVPDEDIVGALDSLLDSFGVSAQTAIDAEEKEVR